MQRFSTLDLVVVVLLVSIPTLAQAEDETFTFFDTAFLPTGVNITVGDTVTFQWSSGSHEVFSGESSDPGDNPGELFQGLVNEQNPSFSYTFTLPGVYSFFCGEHETGLVGTIIVEAFTVEVGVVDLAFTPQNVQIFQGDQVQWNWIEGIHTVTSGESSDPGDNPGELFDELMIRAQPVFLYLFTEPGLVPYFCIPHEIFNMDGTVLVQRLFIRGDVNGDSGLGLPDVITLLGHLFQQQPAPSCLDAADTTDNGTLALDDAIGLLNLLFLNGPPLPAPYPNPGPDRTPDALLCE